MTYDPVAKTWTYPVVTMYGNPVPSGYMTFLELRPLGNGQAQDVHRFVRTKTTPMPGGWWLVSTEM
jgi:hypothetical protein